MKKFAMALAAFLLLVPHRAFGADGLQMVKNRLKLLDYVVVRDTDMGVLAVNLAKKRPILVGHILKRMGNDAFHFYTFVSFYHLKPYAKQHMDEVWRFINDMENRNNVLTYIDKDGDLRAEYTHVGSLDELKLFLAVVSFFEADLDTIEKDARFDSLFSKPQ